MNNVSNSKDAVEASLESSFKEMFNEVAAEEAAKEALKETAEELISDTSAVPDMGDKIAAATLTQVYFRQNLQQPNESILSRYRRYLSMVTKNEVSKS